MKTIAQVVLGIVLVIIGAIITQTGIVYSILGGAIAGLGIGLIFYVVKSRRADGK